MPEYFISVISREKVLYRRDEDAPECARLMRGGLWQRNGWPPDRLNRAPMKAISADEALKMFPKATATAPSDNCDTAGLREDPLGYWP